MRELHLGHVRIVLLEGEPLNHPRQALYVAVNARGVMASGLPGTIRLAGGAEVERELRERGNLLVGQAYLTGPGRLAQRGVARIVHGITTSEPGLPPKRIAVEEAIASALELLDEARTRSVTLPEIGTRIPGITLEDAADILVNAVGSRIRRGRSLEEVLIVGLHLVYLRRCRDRFLAMGATLT